MDSPTIVARPMPMRPEGHEIARIIGDVVLVGPGLGQPVAALVVSEDTKIRRKDLDDLVPDTEVGAERIDEDKRRPVAPALIEIVGDEAVGLQKFHKCDSPGLHGRRAGRSTCVNVPVYQMRAKAARRAAAPFRG